MKNNQRTKAIVGGICVMLLVLFLFNSQLIIGQIIAWIHPSGSTNMSLVPAETSVDYGTDRIIIPTINVEAPLITDMRDTAEPQVQKALERGVLNFGPTALPGQGNSAIVGHSSNNVWSPGDYKFVFALLERVKTGEKIYVIHKNVRYEYVIRETKTVEPTDISVLQPTDKSQVTLITCTPVGTALRRFVVIAEQSSPQPQAAPVRGSTPTITQLPGN